MNPLWLMRMARWLRHPPSKRRLRLVLAVVGICVVLFLIEYVFGWPEALTVDNPRRAPGLRLNAP